MSAMKQMIAGRTVWPILSLMNFSSPNSSQVIRRHGRKRLLLKTSSLSSCPVFGLPIQTETLPIFLLFRQQRYIPAAAQGAHQAHAGRKLPALKIDRSHLITEKRLLSGQHLEIAGHAALVARI